MIRTGWSDVTAFARCIVRGRDPTHTNVLLVVIETETAALREKA